VKRITPRRVADVVAAWRADAATRAGFEPIVFGKPVPAKPRPPRPAAAPVASPLSPPARQLFSQHTPGEEFEYLRVDLGDRVRVPSGALIHGGDLAWRRMEVP
jgi:hypothetical protein